LESHESKETDNFTAPTGAHLGGNVEAIKIKEPTSEELGRCLVRQNCKKLLVRLLKEEVERFKNVSLLDLYRRAKDGRNN
jgi:hypothetical protein